MTDTQFEMAVRSHNSIMNMPGLAGDIARAHAAGKTIREISNIQGIKRARVSYILAKCTVIYDVATDWLSGKTTDYLKSTHGIKSTTTIYDYLELFGVDRIEGRYRRLITSKPKK